MSENVLSNNDLQNGKILDLEMMTIPEIAEEIRKGDRECMMRMYQLLHDDLFAIARKTIQSARQAEFIVRKTFAEVYYDCKSIDPDLFELNLIQVLAENTRKEDIHNTYTMPLRSRPNMTENAESSSPIVNTIRAKAMPARLVPASVAAAAGAMGVPMENEETVSGTVYDDGGSQSLSKTLSMPVLLSSAAALAAVGIGSSVYQEEQERKRDLSYTEMMEALNISFEKAADGTEVTNFEYTPNAVTEISDLIVEYSGDLQTSTDAIDLSRVGSTIVTYSLSDIDAYQQIGRATVSRSYTVTDTQLPVITTTTDSVSITAGDSFDALSLVGSVADPADGELVRVDAAPAVLENDSLGRMYETGWYTVTSNVDNNTAGTYSVDIYACDNHGNVSQVSIPVVVEKKVTITSTTVTVTSTSASVNTGENASIIYTYLTTEAGFTKAAAAGVLANIQIESSFNPAVGTSYYGLCQWGGSRLSNLIAYCAANGYASDSVEGQIRFMVYEMGSGMIAVMNSVSDSAEGAAEAGVYFRTKYERSAGLNNVANVAASFYCSL